MSKKSKVLITVLIIVLILLLVFINEILPFINEKKYKNQVFDDMKDNSDLALRSIVGIIPESEQDGLKKRDGVGSGVIFEKNGNTYYAVTAAHVVEDNSKKYKLFTKDTKFSGDIYKLDDNVNFEIPDENYYESLLDVKIEYVSDTSDLAIISFNYEGDLLTLDFENKKINKNDRIMVIGHPEGNKYKVTYGNIISGLRKVKLKTISTGIIKEDKVVAHNAYMNQGNSGGVALSENFKILGINIGGSFTIFGSYIEGYMIPYDIVESVIEKWRNE